MFVKSALPLAAALSISFAAIAQQTAEAQSQNLPGARYYSEPSQPEGPARAAAIRRVWLASGHQAELPPLQPPSLTGGNISPQSFNVANPPAAPKLTVKFKTGNSGIDSLSLTFHSTSASRQSLYFSHYVPDKSPAVTKGTWTLQDIGNSVGYGAFNPWSDPGKWILDSAYIYDQAGNYA